MSMTALEAIEMAKRLMQMPDEFAIASALIHLEIAAEQRGVTEMAADVREILHGPVVQA